MTRRVNRPTMGRPLEATVGRRLSGTESDLHLVNAEMREMAAARDWLDPEWEFLCECGTCQERVPLSAKEYDRRIAENELILAPGHAFGAAAEARRTAR